MPVVTDVSRESANAAQLFRWFRGGTLSAFSQVEFGMMRIMSQLQDRPELAKPLARAPYNAETRADTFRRVFADNPALSKWADDANDIAGQLENLIRLRSFLAHGFARIQTAEAKVVIRKFQPEKGDEWREVSMELPFALLLETGPKIDEFSQKAVGLFREISDSLDLGF